MLKLSSNLALPKEAITETFGVIAARGAGKSNTAAVMAEEMFAASLPFCVIDPVGSWWGLRSDGSGSGPGIPIAIFGGPKGDVPLERGGGQLVADLVVGQRLSCVLDLRDFESEAAKKQFLLDFARRLYAKNEAPLHLFLEEADDYIPQRPMRDEAQLLRAWENIVRRGRARGLGMTMITQRSAVINKNVLTQVQTLIAMRTTGPQDRKAIEEWLKFNDQSKDILESLPGLADGEAWVWSPQFLKTTVRTKFRRRRTFDSGSTPKMAAKGKTATLADIDMSALREQMAETIERAEAEDPKALRRRIAELERELLVKAETVVDAEYVAELEHNIRIRNDLLNERRDKVRGYYEILAEVMPKLEKLLALLEFSDWPDAGDPAVMQEQPGSGGLNRIKTPEKPGLNVLKPAKAAASDVNGAKLPKAQESILRAFWWLRSEAATPTKVAFYSGYRQSGHFNSTISVLRSSGLVEGWRITAAGEAIMASIAEPKPGGPELREWLRPKLGAASNAMLDALIAANGRRLSNEELAAATGYQQSGHFNSSLSTLRTLGAAEGYTKDGGTKIADVLL